jgi:hypothetical protein
MHVPQAGAGKAVTFADDPFKTAVRNVTVLAALIAYVGLAIYILVLTWQASGGKPPNIPGVQSASLGALAVALGAGYAVILGVPPKPAVQGFNANESWWTRFRTWISSQPTGTKLLGLGALAYLMIGMGIATTYAFNESETPAVLRTIAVGFGGYVIAYLGAAYQKLAD